MPTKTTKTTQKTGAKVDVKDLLAAGAHFGHKTSHWNPKMRPYIYARRGNIYIIDLVKTAVDIERALDFVREVAAGGKNVLYVGTKRHLREVVREVATAAGMPYVTNRWLGGTLTNFATIHQRIKHLRQLEDKLKSGELKETYNKREVGEFAEEAAKLRETLDGIRDMDELPAAVFVTSAKADRIAVAEASRLGMPVIAIADTNADPELVDYVIAANDDAASTVKLIGEYVAAAIAEGRARGSKVTTVKGKAKSADTTSADTTTRQEK